MNVTVALMVKNELSNLIETVPFFKENFEEVVIIDTGSTDGSIDFLKEQNIKFKVANWNYDFAEIRNMLIEESTGDYILMLDADERIDEEFVSEMRKELKMPKSAYEVKIINITDSGSLNVSHINIRLFKRDGLFYYEGKIHEQLKHPQGYMPAKSKMILKHYGYQSEVVMAKDKRRRNMRIIKDELKRNPNDPFQNFNYSTELIGAKKYNEAILHLKIAARNGHRASYEAEIYRNIIFCLMETKRTEDAETVAREAIKRFKKDTRFYFVLAGILQKQGRLEDAEYTMKMGLGAFLSNGKTIDGTENVYLLWEMLKISKRKRKFEDIIKITDILNNLTNQSIDVIEEELKVLMHSYEQEEVYEWIKEKVKDQEKQETLFFEYRIKKGIKEIPMNRIMNLENRIIKLWESSRYEKITKEVHSADIEQKSKLLAYLFSNNLERNRKEINDLVLENKTIRAINQFINGNEVKALNYNGEIFVNIIEELIKQKKLEEFSKVIQMFHFFDKKYWKQIANLLDNYYFDETAITLYIHYLNHIETDFDVWVKVAELLYAQQNWDDCMLLSEKASQLNKNNFRPLELMILSLEQKKDYHLAKQLISELKNQVSHSQFIKNRER
ncbi:glycosyltransferase [Bacillus mexicanus]|uniref:glycosyltransferase n=1 Tax=Bacillus mexicanus TaxID=2834415 RepID=UPI003D21BA35